MEATTTAVVQYVPQETIPILSGCFAFGSTLAVSTMAQKVIGISTATKILPSIFGIATVCMASLCSQHVAVTSHNWMQQELYRNRALSSSQRGYKSAISNSNNSKNRRHHLQQPYWNVVGLNIPKHDVRVCVVGLLTFRLLGGRFWAIAPSSYTNLGSFKRWSIPCGSKYASSTERALIERMGRKWGCHTCGSRMLFGRVGKHKFVGDHMPPKSVAEAMNNTWIRRWGILKKVQYRFYPQCFNCSQTQGSILSKASQEVSKKSSSSILPSFFAGNKVSTLKNAGGGRMAYYHGLRFRINHLTGGVLAATTVVDATNEQIQTKNQKRFEKLQYKLNDIMKQNLPFINKLSTMDLFKKFKQ